MATFKDNFSKQSDLYVKYRPHYPTALYAYLASLTGGHGLAWDCGTGNGQAATGLAAFYDEVVATDPSGEQIRNALPHQKVSYKVEKAERTSLAGHSVDLITVANALHWFDFEAFYTEARRVLKRSGIIAAWAYALPSIMPEIDKAVKYLHDVTLNEYWLPENRLVEQGYTTIPFPFEQIDTPAFACEKVMCRADFIGYLNTWSATQRFIGENGTNPTDNLSEELEAHWGDNEEKMVAWKLVMKAGRV